METIYLDYNATTPVDPEVVGKMKPFLDELYGNPSSTHSQGIRARMAVENARKQVAGMLGCRPDEVIFTSGGTESNNLAIKGIAGSRKGPGNHIITSAIEHPSVLEVCRYLEKSGFAVTYLPVDKWGFVDPAEVEKSIRKKTILISIMHANNETGTIQPIEEIGKIARKHDIPFHSDAAQSCGKIPVNINRMKVDLLSVAGHKMYAPKGVGALYVRRGVRLEKLIHGAGHEHDLRAGTENVASLVGFGKACEIVSVHLRENQDTMKMFRDRLHKGILEKIPGLKLNGHPVKRLPNTLNVSFPGIDAALLLGRMDSIGASLGAACHSGSEILSPVLEAMKVPRVETAGSIRFSVGKMTREPEIRDAVSLITKTYLEITGAGHPKKTPRPGASSGIRLTSYTHSLGCACKIRPRILESVLKEIPLSGDPRVLVDHRTADDAAAYKIDPERAILQTVDFIPPVVDDPYDYGSIAAANALSDIYAMGGVPLFALGIAGFPVSLLPEKVLRRILKGAADKTAEAGIPILGGHTIEETEPKFGLVVTGMVHPAKILTNAGARPGDRLVLTKPIGTGILTAALKKGILDKKTGKELIRTMSQLNRTAAEILRKYPVHALTDITGFGLLGHLKEMITASKTGAEIGFLNIPVMKGVNSLVTPELIPGGTVRNLEYVSGSTRFDPSLSRTEKYILADAQTSGGLLIALPGKPARLLLQDLLSAGITGASLVGKITGEKGKIGVRTEIRDL